MHIYIRGHFGSSLLARPQLSAVLRKFCGSTVKETDGEEQGVLRELDKTCDILSFGEPL